MALEKTTYVIGDILSADKVNDMQDAIIELQNGGGGGGGSLPEMQDKTITENGVYTSDYPYYGLGVVTVDTDDQWVKKAEMLDSLFYCKPVIDFTEFNVYNAWSIAYLFRGCNSLTDMTINGKSISIAGYAFANCPYLTNVTFNCEVNNTSVPSTAIERGSSFDYMFSKSSAEADCLNIHFKGKPFYSHNMFRDCLAKEIKITTDYMGDIITINENYIFYGCTNLKTFKPINFPNVKWTNCAYMFQNCTALTEVELDTSACNHMYYMFYGCKSLKTVTLSSLKSMTSTSNTYNLNNIIDSSCTALENFTITEENTTVTSIDLHYATNLTVESMLSIFNSLKARSSVPSSSSRQGVVNLGSTNLAKLTEEQKAIATNKNWLLV